MHTAARAASPADILLKRPLMQYDIRLHLHYDYARSSGGSRHQIRVAPRTIDGVQRVVASSLSFDPAPAERSDFIDFFGNNATTISFRDEHETLDIRMNARVAVSRPEPGLDVSTDLARLRHELADIRTLRRRLRRTTFSPPAISSTSTPRSPTMRAPAWRRRSPSMALPRISAAACTGISPMTARRRRSPRRRSTPSS